MRKNNDRRHNAKRCRKQAAKAIRQMRSVTSNELAWSAYVVGMVQKQVGFRVTGK